MRASVPINIFSINDLADGTAQAFAPLMRPVARGAFPRVRAVDAGSEFVISAEVPGVSSDELDVSVLPDRVILRGHSSTLPQAGELLHAEFESRDFERTLVVPAPIERASMTRTLADGVLTVRVRKVTDRAEPRISESA